jgi:hypothetical protein
MHFGSYADEAGQMPEVAVLVGGVGLDYQGGLDPVTGRRRFPAHAV